MRTTILFAALYMTVNAAAAQTDGWLSIKPDPGFAYSFDKQEIIKEATGGVSEESFFSNNETWTWNNVSDPSKKELGDVSCFSCVSAVAPDEIDSGLFSKTKRGETLIIKGEYLLTQNPNYSKESFVDAANYFGLEVEQIANTNLYLAKETRFISNSKTIAEHMNNRAQQFISDPSILFASPDTYTQNGMVIKSELDPNSEVSQIINSSIPPVLQNEEALYDMEVPFLWSVLPVGQDFRFGIYDQGFQPHEDLIFDPDVELPEDGEGDHGNHVAGLACGRHDNAGGLDGVLPNCTIVVRPPRFVENTATTDNERFSQQIVNLLIMLNENRDVKTFSVSLGMSMPKEVVANPNSDAAENFIETINLQAQTAIMALQVAEDNGQTVFFAAGNDSSQFANIPARFGSPFNYAAISIQPKTAGIRSGIVVQAHDQRSGRKWVRSNIGAHLSCPGVDLYSSVARDSTGKRVTHAYGRKSGTSMATPLCAAAFEGLRVFLDPPDIGTFRNCVISSGEAVYDFATHKFKIEKAARQCGS